MAIWQPALIMNVLTHFKLNILMPTRMNREKKTEILPVTQDFLEKVLVLMQKRKLKIFEPFGLKFEVLELKLIVVLKV